MNYQSQEISILSLPYDLILHIIARVSRIYYPTLSLVSKKIRSVVASPELYKSRSLLNRAAESCLYLCLRYHLDPPRDPKPHWFALCEKPNRTLTDRSIDRLFIPITSPDVRHERSSGLTSTDVSLVAVGSNIYKIGGYMTSSSSEVSVLDCRFNTWHSAPMMREKRSSPAASVVDEKIYVAGGGCEDLNWVEVFDPKTQTWGSVTNPDTEIRPEEEVKSFGFEGRFYVYGEKPKYVVYDPKEGRWEPIGLGMHMDDVTSAVYFFHGVIGDVMFLWNDGEFRWYDSKARSWKSLNGVEDLPDFGGEFKMVDLGGKMAVLWQSYDDHEHMEEKFIWCAEIGLERRDGDEMWGNVEWCDIVLTTRETCGLFDADVLCVTV